MMRPPLRQGSVPPFHKMPWHDFQGLCRDLFYAEQDVAVCDVYGTQGQPQDGIDLLARRAKNNGIEVGQCKCRKAFPPGDIARSSDEFFKHWDRWSTEGVRRFILFVACELDRKEQQDSIGEQIKRFQAHGIVYEAWSASNIRNKLRPHRPIVTTYFGHAGGYWENAICGTEPFGVPRTVQGAKATPVASSPAGPGDRLASQLSKAIKDGLERVREIWREGQRDEAVKWVGKWKYDLFSWGSLSAQGKAEILCFESRLELDMGNIDRAEQLADEARGLAPARSQARLRALIAHRRGESERALALLENEQDIESLNLKAALLLEMGRTDEGLAILSFSAQGSNSNDKSQGKC